MFTVGDLVVVKDAVYHKGYNIGGKIACIVSINSYIMVSIEDYDDNPVKCFRYELQHFIEPPIQNIELEEEIEKILEEYNGLIGLDPST